MSAQPAELELFYYLFEDNIVRFGELSRSRSVVVEH